MLEDINPLLQTQVTTQSLPLNITKLMVSKDGQIDFEGVVDKDTSALLERAMEQAEYYKQKASKLEEQKVKRNSEVDAITIIFASCVGAMTVFLTYIMVSSLVGLFNGKVQSVNTTNNIQQVNYSHVK